MPADGGCERDVVYKNEEELKSMLIVRGMGVCVLSLWYEGEIIVSMALYGRRFYIFL